MTVQELELSKVRHLFAELHLFQRDCKNKFGNISTQTNAISKRKKIEIPDWRQMEEIFKGFKMIISLFDFRWRNQPFKGASFFKIRIVPADGEEGETEAGADGGEASFELGIPAEREKGEVAAANP